MIKFKIYYFTVILMSYPITISNNNILEHMLLVDQTSKILI